MTIRASFLALWIALLLMGLVLIVIGTLQAVQVWRWQDEVRRVAWCYEMGFDHRFCIQYVPSNARLAALEKCLEQGFTHDDCTNILYRKEPNP